jgi:mono/diheme cytochrome c family protein
MVFEVAALGMALGTLALAQDAKAERGKKVFAEQKCKICHSIGGVGNAKGVLDGVGGKLSATDIKEWLTNPKDMATKAKADRKPPMKSFKDLSADDLDALVVYLGSLKK